jgi:hypothetical protein
VRLRERSKETLRTEAEPKEIISIRDHLKLRNFSTDFEKREREREEREREERGR